MMKTRWLIRCVLVLSAAGLASADLVANVPDGVTGLWTFFDLPVYQTAAIGQDLVGNAMGTGLLGPDTQIGTLHDPDLYTTNKVIQTRNYNSYLQVNHNIGANGGGSLTNQYTVALDYRQTQANPQNSLFNTYIDSPTATEPAELRFLRVGDEGFVSTIGSEATGYSTQTLVANDWHRIVWSVQNGVDGYFRVYVDGILFLDAPGQAIDGDYALNNFFHMFTGAGWSDNWGICGNLMTWNRALSGEEIAPMGGWSIGDTVEDSPTPLLFVPEPTSLAILALGGLLALRRKQ